MKLVNLTPTAVHGCHVPITWLCEFLKLEEGQSCEKNGLAWWYSSPQDRVECSYRASVEDGVLHVEVEVGPEALIRRAAFPVFEAELGVEAETVPRQKELTQRSNGQSKTIFTPTN